VRRPLAALAAALGAASTGALVTVSGYALAGSPAGADDALGPGPARVEIGIHHSRFDVGSLQVRAGTVLEIVVRNDDPIAHELVLGTEEVHARHRGGTEGRHPPVPGEVSVGAGDTGLTFYELTEPGTYEYACHLPGHEAYGMRGVIEVLPAP
jgi:uncharacterized cupredoxin-like copper-binding protein